VSALSGEALDDVDAGWDDAPSDASPIPVAVESAGRTVAVRPNRMSKRERRAFEREQRTQSRKRRAERRAEDKRERMEALRRAAQEREAERKKALERAEAARKKEEKRRAKKRSAAVSGNARHAPERSRETESEPLARRRRFQMPNGGWIVFVIGLITLGTAWYAFAR
jgi:predicted ribosome quality control (RQC) complex YloA/Tae2 family protein